MYQIGDKVLIKNLDWYNENKDEDGIVELSTHIFTPGMSQFCGKVMTIEDVFEDIDDNVVYYMVEIDYDWTDEMIECKVEEEMSLDKAGQITDFEYEGLAYTLPDGYIFKDENGNVIKATKIVLEKKKEYPKTYEECSVLLGCEDKIPLKIIGEFIRLINARNAYWKLYGEEMGLEDMWDPDYDYSSPPKYTISCYFGDIIKEKYCGQYNRLLSFPTEEMRDEFYNNFNKEIEICKNLL